MQIIMICGKARSGKDTISDFMQKELEKSGKKVCRIQVSSYTDEDNNTKLDIRNFC